MYMTLWLSLFVDVDVCGKMWNNGNEREREEMVCHDVDVDTVCGKV